MEKIENPSPDERCSFCFSAVNNPLRYGEMYRYKNIITHYFCILMSTGIKQNGDDDEGLYGFLLDDIQKGLERARNIKCIYCKRGGATAQCNHYYRSSRKKCLVTFHLTCGVTHGSQHLFYGQFQSMCHLHRRAQRIPTECVKESAVSCGMCFDMVHDLISSSSLWAPCCKKSYFHRDCVQQLAFTSGGYHFRCPLCNNENQFKLAMQKCGIFVPIRDALWETEPNAFSELYVEHNQCDVEPCLCPHSTKEGDKRTYNSGAWDLIRCGSCGSEGTHRPCSGLPLTGELTWNCASCRTVLKRKEEDGEGERDEIQKTIEPDTCCACYCVCKQGRNYQTNKGMFRTIYCMECELSWIHARCRNFETGQKGLTSDWTCVGCLASDGEESTDITPTPTPSTSASSAAHRTAVDEKTKKQVSTPCQVVLTSMRSKSFYRTISHLLSYNAFRRFKRQNSRKKKKNQIKQRDGQTSSGESQKGPLGESSEGVDSAGSESEKDPLAESSIPRSDIQKDSIAESSIGLDSVGSDRVNITCVDTDNTFVDVESTDEEDDGELVDRSIVNARGNSDAAIDSSGPIVVEHTLGSVSDALTSDSSNLEVENEASSGLDGILIAKTWSLSTGIEKSTSWADFEKKSCENTICETPTKLDYSLWYSDDMFTNCSDRSPTKDTDQQNRDESQVAKRSQILAPFDESPHKENIPCQFNGRDCASNGNLNKDKESSMELVSTHNTPTKDVTTTDGPNEILETVETTTGSSARELETSSSKTVNVQINSIKLRTPTTRRGKRAGKNEFLDASESNRTPTKVDNSWLNSGEPLWIISKTPAKVETSLSNCNTPTMGVTSVCKNDLGETSEWNKTPIKVEDSLLISGEVLTIFSERTPSRFGSPQNKCQMSSARQSFAIQSTGIDDRVEPSPSSIPCVSSNDVLEEDACSRNINNNEEGPARNMNVNEIKTNDPTLTKDSIEHLNGIKYYMEETERIMPDLSSGDITMDEFEDESSEQLETSFQTVKRVIGGIFETVLGSRNKAKDKPAEIMKPERIIVEQNKDERNRETVQLSERSIVNGDENSEHKRKWLLKATEAVSLKKTSVDSSQDRDLYDSGISEMRDDLEEAFDSIDAIFGSVKEKGKNDEMEVDQNDAMGVIEKDAVKTTEEITQGNTIVQNNLNNTPKKDDNEVEVDQTDSMSDIEEDAVKTTEEITQGNTMVQNNLNNTPEKDDNEVEVDQTDAMGDIEEDAVKTTEEITQGNTMVPNTRYDTNNERHSTVNNSVTTDLDHGITPTNTKGVPNRELNNKPQANDSESPHNQIRNKRRSKIKPEKNRAGEKDLDCGKTDWGGGESVKQDHEKSMGEVGEAALNADEGNILNMVITTGIKTDNSTPNSVISSELETESVSCEQTENSFAENEDNSQSLIQIKSLTKILDGMSKVTKIQDRIFKIKIGLPSNEATQELNETKLDKQGDASKHRTPEDKKIKPTSSRTEYKPPSTPMYSTKKIYEYFSCSERKLRHDDNDDRVEFSTKSTVEDGRNRNRASKPTVVGRKRVLTPSELNEEIATKRRRIGNQETCLAQTPAKASTSLMKTKTSRSRNRKCSATADTSWSRKIYDFFSFEQTTHAPNVHVTPSTGNTRITDNLMGSSNTSKRSGSLSKQTGEMSKKNKEMSKECGNIGTSTSDVSKGTDWVGVQSNRSNDKPRLRKSRRLSATAADTVANSVNVKARELRRKRMVRYIPDDMTSSSSSDESPVRSRSTAAQTPRDVALSDSDTESAQTQTLTRSGGRTVDSLRLELELPSASKRNISSSENKRMSSPHLGSELKSASKISSSKKEQIDSAHLGSELKSASKISSSENKRRRSLASEAVSARSVRAKLEDRLLRPRPSVNYIEDENFSPNKNRGRSREAGNSVGAGQESGPAKRASRRLTLARKDLSLWL